MLLATLVPVAPGAPVVIGKKATTKPHKIKKPPVTHLTIKEYLATFLYSLVPKKATRTNTIDSAIPIQS
ncbi:hypothetical protein FACS1894218_3530 [Bacilli bacterium]|nr:hypothetical protein FACS1894218_3530 [Bacilli bacterium]